MTELLLRLSDLLLPAGELPQIRGELLLAGLEVGRSETQHPLDGRPRVPKQLLPPLELGDRGMQLLRVRVELLATTSEELLEALLGIRPGREHPPDDSSAALLLAVGLVLAAGFSVGHSCLADARDAGGPILSRRVRSDPPAQRDFFGVGSTPAA